MAVGQWNLFGINLPDLGITEALGIGTPNPNVVGSSPMPEFKYGNDDMSNFKYGPDISTGGNKTNTVNRVPVSTPTPQGQPQPQGTPSVDDAQARLMAEVDNLYNQVNPILGQAESNLSKSRDLSLESVNTQKAQAERTQQSALEEALNLAKSQRTTTEQTKARGEADAVRSYNQLSQQYLSRFGTGASIGGALGEIVAQEFARNQGNIRQAYQSSLDKIFAYEGQATRDFNNAKLKLEEDTKLMVERIDQDFRDKMTQIAMSRVANEQAKSQARIQVLQDSIAFARQIEAYKIEAAVQLDTWMQQQKATVESGLATAQQMAAQAQDNPFTTYNNEYSTPTGTQRSIDYLAYKPRNTRNEEQDFLTPWA